MNHTTNYPPYTGENYPRRSNIPTYCGVVVYGNGNFLHIPSCRSPRFFRLGTALLTKATYENNTPEVQTDCTNQENKTNAPSLARSLSADLITKRFMWLICEQHTGNLMPCNWDFNTPIAAYFQRCNRFFRKIDLCSTSKSAERFQADLNGFG